jgi:KaiC/GvpD/RAD55 family RecA-like ATPase/tetratricopeptide (TPR) repeat protein
MANDHPLQSILAQAVEREKEYDWVGAISFYKKALSRELEEKKFVEASEIQEKIGERLFLVAFQAENSREFRKYLQSAIEALERTIELLGKSEGNEASHTKLLHSSARIAYLGHFLSTEPNTRRKLLDNCLKSMREVLTACSEARDSLGLGKASVEMATYLADRLDLEADKQVRARLIEEALDLGENAIKIFSQARNKRELAESLYTTAVHYYNAALSLQTSKRKCEQKAYDYAKGAIKILENIGDELLLGRAIVLLGEIEEDLGGGPEAASELFRKAMKYGIETKDKRIIAEAFDGLALASYWNMTVEEDLEKIREKSKRCEEYASRAISCGICTDYGRIIPHSYSMGYCDNLCTLAKRETRSETRSKLLEEAVKIGRQGLGFAENLGATHAYLHASEGLVQALYQLSTMKTGLEKRRILEEGLALGEKTVFFAEQLRPHFSWPRVLSFEASALITFELSRLEENTEKRKELLEKSVARMESCVANFQKHVSAQRASRKEFFALLGRFQTELGRVLNELHRMTNKEDVLRKIIESYENAVRMNEKADMVTWAAEAYWNIAKVLDQLAEYTASAKNFESAARSYELVAEKLPQLRSFYADYSLYMQAWSEIERARHHHASHEYGRARKHYEKAAELHRSTKSWSYLAPNYLAWTQLEHGEDLSRDEKSQEALQAFRRAAELFGKTKRTLANELSRVMDIDERDLVERLIKASEYRRTYCLGRIALEEAKILDRQGDHYSSSQKYGQASDEFQKTADAMEHEADRRELKPIISLCQAWHTMTRAEAEASPDLFLEASELFDKAKTDSIDERAKMLALGHSSFCRALEAGTRFERARDPELYSAATQHLASSANYYLRAGFETASEYAKATQRLFDAYVYMDTAKKEIDPERKAKFYIMAEKVLQIAANSYLKAKHIEKSEEARRILESVREERQLAMSLTEVLHAPGITSSTTSFATPAPTNEEAVGLRKFEHAIVQANLTSQSKEVVIAEDFLLQMHIVNVGKEAVLLAGIEGILPSGFEVVKKPDQFSLENSHVNMKGKRLNPLETEKVELILRSFDKGAFTISPKITYVDETGHQMTCQPEPLIIKVSETAFADRITTGYKELDELLLGGLPQNYAVVLTSRSCDERDKLVRRFLETGAEKGETTFYVTIDPAGIEKLAEKYQTNFHLFVCSPQADATIKNAPNIIKLKGVENLTDISIALSSAFRGWDTRKNNIGRGCIGIVSDVLLQHHAVVTRKWLASLIPELRTKGFTTLAVLDPEMHTSQEVRAILDLFEGEINIYEKKTEDTAEKSLRIRKMQNCKYSRKELHLS